MIKLLGSSRVRRFSTPWRRPRDLYAVQYPVATAPRFFVRRFGFLISSSRVAGDPPSRIRPGFREFQLVKVEHGRLTGVVRGAAETFRERVVLGVS